MHRAEIEERRSHTSWLRPYSTYAFQIPFDFPFTPLHWHREYELTLIEEGSSDYTCGSERFRVSAGDIVLVPANALHAIQLQGGQQQRYHVLIFASEMLHPAVDDRSALAYLQPLEEGRDSICNPIRPDHPGYEEIRQAVDSAFACAAADGACHDLLLRSSLLRLLWLLENHGLLVHSTNEHPRNNMIRSVLTYIDEHYKENLSVAALAAIAHLSENYFVSQFKKAVGMGVVAYINQKRISHACRLLLSAHDAIATIAAESGFHNLSHFNRQFRRIVGCTPQEYKTRVLSDDAREGGVNTMG